MTDAGYEDLGEPNDPALVPGAEPDPQRANHAVQHGLGVGAAEIAAQREPEIVVTPDDEDDEEEDEEAEAHPS